MSLKLKINSCLNNCNTLTITEETGLYDVDDNTGGYGSPNVTTSDIIEAVLTIESLTDDVTYSKSYDVTSIVLDSLTGEELLQVIVNDFEDGRYCITYTITTEVGGVQSIYTITHKLYVYCNVECCVNSYTLELPEMLCDICNKDKIIGKLNTMQTMLHSIRASEYAGNDCAFENILSRLNKICDNESDYVIKSCGC